MSLEEMGGSKVVVAMSGGVDSSVAAALLKAAGAQVSGVFMLLAQPDAALQVARVRAIADFLEIGLEVVDLRQDFRREVLDYFAAAYRGGRTPNPCVVCNRRIKFGALLDRLAAGTWLATGHYARISRDRVGDFHLRQGVDGRKDQSYFLARLGQAQLSRLCFPLGEQTKEGVYRLAEGLGLSGRHGSESQDICFLQNQSVAEFLAGFSPQHEEPGEVIGPTGAVLGHHRGLSRYTVGQRRGLGLPDVSPWYVLALDPVGNRLLVGKEADLYRDRLVLVDLHWSSGMTEEMPSACGVRIRHRHRIAEAHLSRLDGERVLVAFSEAQRAVTPGQFAVFYEGDRVLGCGEIVA